MLYFTMVVRQVYSLDFYIYIVFILLTFLARVLSISIPLLLCHRSYIVPNKPSFLSLPPAMISHQLWLLVMICFLSSALIGCSYLITSLFAHPSSSWFSKDYHPITSRKPHTKWLFSYCTFLLIVGLASARTFIFYSNCLYKVSTFTINEYREATNKDK